MKAFHYVNVMLIIIFLVAICWLEERQVSKSLEAVQDRAFEIERLVEDKTSLLDSEVAIKVDNLEYRWSKDEVNLCYLVNHKSMQEIGVEISKLKAYIATDDIDAFKVSLSQLQLFCRTYLHFMGASIHNVM